MTIKSANAAGETSRDALLQTGLELFGQYGYNTVTVRQICEAAEVNIASINYHFGGKEGLYLAVADHISLKLQERMAPIVEPILRYVEDPNPDQANAIEYIQNIIEMMATVLVPESVEAEHWARFITRFQLGDDTPDHDLSRHNILDLVAQLIGIVRGEHDLSTKSQQNAVLAQMLFGQALVFRVSRTSAKHALGITQFGSDEFDLIKRILRNNIRAILQEYSDEQ